MFSYDNEDAVESNSLQEIIYLGSQTFDWEEIPSVIVTSYESSHQPISKILQKITTGINEKMRIAVCVGSNILFYGVELDPEEELEQAQNWHRLYTLETSLTDIRYIQFALNHVAIVSSSSIQGPMCHLSFWSEIRVDVSPTLYTSFEFSEPIIDIAWNVSCDAQYILAIAFAKKISVYGQKRTIDSSGYQDHWTCYHEFTVDMPNPIVGIAWLDNSIMAVASGNQLGCYLKWLISKNELTPELLLDSEGQPMLNIYDVSYHMNGPLPIYHPNSLIFYLMWGNTTLINYVLLSVYKFLRCYSEEDDIDQMPHFSFETIIKLQNVSKSTKPILILFVEEYKGISKPEQLLGDENNTRPLTLTETNYLISCLKSKTIPGLSQKERMHLVAMVDTFVEVSAQGDALDENGIRFTALLENHFHLQRILESQQQPQVLRPCDFIWALHSQSQDLLLDRCICLVNNKLMWENARSLGIFLWLRKIDTVRDQMSAIARNTYLSKEELKDPESCTLFYLALRKKNLLLGLWKSASFHKEHAAMCKFLSNDFTQPRWKTAASKNAFVLLGKQRYEYAAAFFLLADKIKDAVSIILKHMKDFQLAIAICRVYLGDNCSLLKEILENNVLSMAIEAKDRWLISIVYSLLERPHDAINATVAPLSEFSKSAYSKDESAFDTVNPNIFIIYNHLKQQLLVQKHQNLRITYDLEYKFSLKVAHAYERLGCPLLALYILTHYAEKPPTIESKFIEEDSSDIKISRAADLFDDETPKRPSYAANLFDDEAASQNLESKSVYKNQEKEDNTISDDHLASYKSLLITRTLQTVFRSISTMYDASDKSGKGSQFQSFLSKKIQDLFNLGEALKVPQKDFYRLLIQKSIETDTFILCLDMLENCVPDDFDMSLFLLSFEKECFQVFEVSPLCSRVIATYSKWSQWLEDYSIALSGASLGVLKLVLINHICLILVTLKMRHFEKTWGLIYCLKSIVECMAYEKRNTYHSNIQSIYTYVLNTTKMTEMTTEDYDSFSDDSVFGFDLSEEVYRPLEDVKDDSIGSSLLELASLNYILYILESSMQATEKTVEIEGR
ncbi:RAVE protein 1 C terminal-domain-containing protein [Spinellus fusiger]|nr:RAVE protein 1 C terminal-domain-containing protein [Spinellus fusiger]